MTLTPKRKTPKWQRRKKTWAKAITLRYVVLWFLNVGWVAFVVWMMEFRSLADVFALIICTVIPQSLGYFLGRNEKKEKDLWPSKK